MSRLLRSGAIFSAMTMISRVLGLVRDAVFARYFPVDGAYEAFLVAFRIPNLMRRLVAEGAFSLAFVPVLSEYKEKRSRAELKDLIDHVTGALVLILLLISIIGIFVSPWIIASFAAGFEDKVGARPELAADLLQITFPYILFISLSALVAGILNTFQHFAIPSLTPVLLNIVLIISAIWIAPLFADPVTALAWGVLVGGIVQLAFQLPFVYKLGLLPKPKFKRGHSGVKKIMKLMAPAVLGSSAAQINLLLNTFIASFLAVGSMGWLYYSDRFVELPLALFGVAIGTVILPKLSQDHANSHPEHNGKQAFSETLDWAIRIGLLIALPATAGLVLLAMPILVTVIGYGAFTWHDTQMSALSLMTYALGLPAFILVKILAPGFYSRQDTKTPVKIGLISIAANMLLNLAIVLPWFMGGYAGAHAGLALSTALAAYLNAGLLFYILHKQGIFQAQTGWLIYSAKIVFATGLMSVLLYFLMPEELWWKQAAAIERITWLLLLIGSAISSFFAILYILRLNIRQLLRH
jgi:putative peptidoglycan lipid II flippase